MLKFHNARDLPFAARLQSVAGGPTGSAMKLTLSSDSVKSKNFDLREDHGVIQNRVPIGVWKKNALTTVAPVSEFGSPDLACGEGITHKVNQMSQTLARHFPHIRI
jgi:hypothetical protein